MAVALRLVDEVYDTENDSIGRAELQAPALRKGPTMTLGTILVILLIIFLLGGFSGRFGGPGYGYGNRGNGLIGLLLIIVVVLLLTGRL